MVFKLEKNKFSIIIANYNSSEFMSRTMDSILNQTYQNFEVLIVDDASIDNSINILSEYAKKDKRIKVFQNSKNLGVAKTRNKALEHVTGQYLCFLDCDDWWPKEKLQLYFEKFKNGYELIYSSYSKYYEKKDSYKFIEVDTFTGYKKICCTNFVPFSTASYDAEKLGIYKFNSKYWPEDWIYWIDIIKENPKIIAINKNLMFYSVGDSNVSKSKFKMIASAWFIFRKYHKYNFFKSFIALYFYAFYAIEKYIK